MVTSIHHYELAESAESSDFHDAVEEAVSRDLFENVPGLVEYQILQGIRGERTDKFAAVWTYESMKAWTAVWGPVDDPVPKTEYPTEWLVWEDELLEPILAEDPDKIEYTSYENITGHGAESTTESGVGPD